MPAFNAVNEWIHIHTRVYNTFALKHIVFELWQDLYLEEEDYMDYTFWLDNYIHNGPMPGFMRFKFPNSDDTGYFLDALEECWFCYWNERESGAFMHTFDEEMEDEDLSDDEVDEIFAVATWVRDIFQEDVVDFEMDDLPVAEILEVVDYSRD